jgi:HSP20 family protein
MSISDLTSWRRRDPTAYSGGPHHFLPLRRDIDRLFGDLRRWRENWRLAPGTPTGFMPAAALTEHDTGYVLTVEVPGMDKESLAIELHGDTLKLSGEKKQEQKTAKSSCVYCECCYGSFQRVIQLPNGVDREKITATFKQGVLTVTLPKVAAARRKAIPVSSD